MTFILLSTVLLSPNTSVKENDPLNGETWKFSASREEWSRISRVRTITTWGLSSPPTAFWGQNHSSKSKPSHDGISWERYILIFFFFNCCGFSHCLLYVSMLVLFFPVQALKTNKSSQENNKTHHWQHLPYLSSLFYHPNTQLHHTSCHIPIGPGMIYLCSVVPSAWRQSPPLSPTWLFCSPGPCWLAISSISSSLQFWRINLLMWL